MHFFITRTPRDSPRGRPGRHFGLLSGPLDALGKRSAGASEPPRALCRALRADSRRSEGVIGEVPERPKTA
eukprot:2385837-Pyramimonas_sp.AAC.1